MSESVNVFATKSLWLPIVGGAVAWVATKLQTFVELSPDDQTAITGAVAALIIIVVRKFTNRPAHILKPKKQET